eukprot:TRINITY_DN4387_c0_g1_i4.p1 TRINITY_DN4387_c0_g1~~TRINITY_DN4387_c0_g1_i4.p1  ORF type:complete len:165 (+),score=5.56 TRINITY_DN4387_c0_g1_i4:61-555(+)
MSKSQFLWQLKREQRDGVDWDTFFADDSDSDLKRMSLASSDDRRAVLLVDRSLPKERYLEVVVALQEVFGTQVWPSLHSRDRTLDDIIEALDAWKGLGSAESNEQLARQFNERLLQQGLSQRDFCQSQGLPEALLSNWLARRGPYSRARVAVKKFLQRPQNLLL